MKRTSILLGLLALSSCASMPDMPKLGGDSVVVFPVAPEAPDAWAAAGVSGTLPETDWLSQFNDPAMTALVTEALASNPGLRAQFFTVDAARAQAKATAGRTLPRVTADGSAGVNSVYSAAADDRFTDPAFGLRSDVSWPVDLWGRLAAGVEAAEADLEASVADLEAAKLTLAAQTAIAWIDLNSSLAQERVAVETFTARERALDLTERRFSRGLATALDVRTARTTLASAEATIAVRRRLSSDAARRLEILLGRYPAAELEGTAQLAELEPAASGGQPALLMARRPDIAAAEARIIAAGLRAEQARLALYPSLTLSASVSNNEDNLVDLLDPTRFALTLLSGISAPIFNGGALRADRDAAIARAQSAAENYASTVLQAWREVEDALAADTLIAQELEAQKVALEEARLAEDLATRQYTNGLVSIFNLIDSQTRRLNAESQVIAARAARASNRVNYHLALGGGLPIEDAASPDPTLAMTSTPEGATQP
ncbi:MAG: efflux transporter outer membrane subunit [Pseudomonadota bacterium]